MSRVTAAGPEGCHTDVKARAAAQRISMKDYVLAALDADAAAAVREIARVLACEAELDAIVETIIRLAPPDEAMRMQARFNRPHG